jgi:acetyl-CoA carboxylase biotin carboxyl carrier protein
MTDDDATTQPEEDAAVIDPGLVDDSGFADPVAVGPGDPGVLLDGVEAPEVTAGAAEEADGDVPAIGPNGGSTADALPVGWTGLATPGDASLLDLVDRLTAVLEKSDLAELEVAAGGTTIILRSPAAVTPAASPVAVGTGVAPAHDGASADGAPAAAPAAAAATAPERPSVKAPLTGIYYSAPSPGATPYVAVGNHVAAGQIIGLIEAMKLYNEIKSDLSGRVVRICAENGALVKAKQPLIEVEPA